MIVSPSFNIDPHMWAKTSKQEYSVFLLDSYSVADTAWQPCVIV